MTRSSNSYYGARASASGRSSVFKHLRQQQTSIYPARGTCGLRRSLTTTSSQGLHQQRLSEFFPHLGSFQSIMILGFTEDGEYLVTVDATCVKLHTLLLARHRVRLAFPSTRPSLQLRTEDLGYSLSESTVFLLLARVGVSCVVSFPSIADEDAIAEEMLEQPVRSGSVAIFVDKSGQATLRRDFEALSVVREHHAIFAATSQHNSHLVCFVNGVSLELFELPNLSGAIEKDDHSTTQAPAPAPRPANLVGVTPIAGQRVGNSLGFFTSSPVEESTGIRHFTFNASLFCPHLVKHAYPKLKSPSIADIEVRVLGPCREDGFVQIVIGLCLLYRGGGKDLACSILVDTTSGDAYPILWIDLRKSESIAVDPNTEGVNRLSWLSIATSRFLSKLVMRDPFLRLAHSSAEYLSNVQMDTHGSLRTLRHPFLPIVIVHDEDQDD